MGLPPRLRLPAVLFVGCLCSGGGVCLCWGSALSWAPGVPPPIADAAAGHGARNLGGEPVASATSLLPGDMQKPPAPRGFCSCLFMLSLRLGSSRFAVFLLRWGQEAAGPHGHGPWAAGPHRHGLWASRRQRPGPHRQ